MRWLDWSFSFLFLLAVAVQYNDPDPLVWMAGYAVAAGLSLAACFGRLPVVPNLLAGIGFTLGFLSLAATLPGAPLEAFTSFEMTAASHEEPREAVGLLLAAGWTFGLAARGRRRGRDGVGGPVRADGRADRVS
ncbi:transmembrane 220 family protein [Myxococcota bacterium]|nr:transmembrane 220 family protein [Myxococcota bacterium]